MNNIREAGSQSATLQSDRFKYETQQTIIQNMDFIPFIFHILYIKTNFSVAVCSRITFKEQLSYPLILSHNQFDKPKIKHIYKNTFSRAFSF